MNQESISTFCLLAGWLARLCVKTLDRNTSYMNTNRQLVGKRKSENLCQKCDKRGYAEGKYF